MMVGLNRQPNYQGVVQERAQIDVTAEMTYIGGNTAKNLKHDTNTFAEIRAPDENDETCPKLFSQNEERIKEDLDEINTNT